MDKIAKLKAEIRREQNRLAQQTFKAKKKQALSDAQQVSGKQPSPRVQSLYEAAQPSRMRKSARDQRSPDLQVQQGAVAVRALARNLEQNHDIVRGALRTLVNNVVGPTGIGIEPQPRRKDGTIHVEYAKALRDAWRDWTLTPEVTHRHHWAKVQRMMAKTWFRDGEAFTQSITGTVSYLDHGTRVPFSLEMFEPDLVPMEYTELSKGIRQGIQRNAWGRPTGLWVWKSYPVDISTTSLTRPNDLKFISWENVLQLATLDRIGQMRGVSEFASVIERFTDIKDIEESERIAAKLASNLTGYVKRTSPEGFQAVDPATGLDTNGNPNPRELTFSAGTIIDTLAVGEEIGLIDSNRPNPNVVEFRYGQLRAAACGIGISNSSLSKNYDGTYSAQRQELVEQWINYAVLTDEFVGQFVQPVWQQFVRAAHLSGVVKMPPDLEQYSEDDCLYVGQSMPWIDPLKEAMAWNSLVRDGFASEVEVIRKRGGNPRDVIEQIAAFRKEAADKELIFNSDAKRTSSAGTAQDYLRFKVSMPETDANPPQDANAAAHREVMSGIAAGITALASRQPPAQNITVAAPEIHNHVAAPEIHNHLPEPVINIEASMPAQEAPTVQVVAAAPVVNVAAPVVNVAAPVVRNEIIVEPAAISKVEITAMPARETTTTITRDERENISTTTQVEKDA